MKLEWKPDKDYKETPHIVKDLYVDGRKTTSWIIRREGGLWGAAIRLQIEPIAYNTEAEAKAVVLARHILESK